MFDTNRVIPHDKHDLKAVDRASEIGFPSLNKVIGELLEWIQDSNWPVAQPTMALLSKAGIEIVPHIIGIFNSNDECWKYQAIKLSGFLGETSWALLSPAILKIAQNPSKEEILEECNVIAKEILANRT